MHIVIKDPLGQRGIGGVPVPAIVWGPEHRWGVGFQAEQLFEEVGARRPGPESVIVVDEGLGHMRWHLGTYRIDRAVGHSYAPFLRAPNPLAYRRAPAPPPPGYRPVTP